MKLKYIAIGILAIGLAACSDELAEKSGSQEQDIRVFGSITNSRVSFNQEDNVTHATWSVGDKIGIFGDTQNNLPYVVASSTSGTVEFQTQAEKLKCVDGTSVVAYYPYSGSVDGIVVPLPNTQKYKYSEMIPFVYAKNMVENNQVSLQFKHLFAYLKVKITKEDLPEFATTSKVSTIEVSASNKDLGVVEGGFNLETLKTSTIEGSSIIVVDAAEYDLSSADFVCYIPVLPQEANQALTVKILQKNGNAEDILFSLPKKASERGLVAGNVYNVTLDDDETLMSPEEQKAKIDAVGREFVSYIRAYEFNEIKNTARYIKETFCEEKSQTDAISTWCDDCLDAISNRGVTVNENDTTEWEISETESEIFYYYYHKTDITRLYEAASFKGHFTVNDTAWVVETTDTDDLQFTCPDENGNICTVRLSTEGDTTKVYVGKNKETDYYNWVSNDTTINVPKYTEVKEIDPATGDTIMVTDTTYNYIHKYINSEDVDVETYHNYLYVPEKVIVEYKKGDKVILKTVVTTDLTSVSNENFDVASHGFSVTVETTVNDYEFIVSKLAYAGSKNAETSFKMNKSGMNLITLSAYSDLALSGDVYEETPSIDKAGNAYLNIDLIHQLQIKATCSDGVKLNDLLEEADNNDTDENIFKQKIGEANELFEGGLYFDGRSTRQSWVTLEAFADNGYWTYEPVLNFEDGSSYSTFSAFFNEKDFKTLINLAWDVLDDFCNLFVEFERDGEYYY